MRPVLEEAKLLFFLFENRMTQRISWSCNLQLLYKKAFHKDNDDHADDDMALALLWLTPRAFLLLLLFPLTIAALGCTQHGDDPGDGHHDDHRHGDGGDNGKLRVAFFIFSDGFVSANHFYTTFRSAFRKLVSAPAKLWRLTQPKCLAGPI